MENIFEKIVLFIAKNYLLFIIVLIIFSKHNYISNAFVDHNGAYNRFAKLLLIVIYLISIPTLFYTLYQILTSRV